MTYNKINNTTALIETENVLFRIDANEMNFVNFGIEPSEEMINEERNRANIHKLLIDDFEIEENLIRFIELLESNPSTAYLIYINNYL